MKQLTLFKDKEKKHSSLKAGCPGKKCQRFDGCVVQVINSNIENGTINEPSRLDRIWDE